jgi:uncharacterized membrane protein (UPF0127 family)
MATFLAPLREDPSGPFELRNERTGRTVAHRLLPAFDSATRRTGLLRHTGLPPGEAMIIAPSSAIHTWFMKFDIDVAFVTRDGDIVKVCEALKPWRMAAAFKAFAVVEMAAGAFAGVATKAGDRLVVVRRDA